MNVSVKELLDSPNKVLERFMKEFFPYGEFKRAGIFTKEMKGDYQAQADKICKWFGYNSVYEYGSTEIRCHLTLGGFDGKKDGLRKEPFITVIESIYK